MVSLKIIHIVYEFPLQQNSLRYIDGIIERITINLAVPKQNELQKLVMNLKHIENKCNLEFNEKAFEKYKKREGHKFKICDALAIKWYTAIPIKCINMKNSESLIGRKSEFEKSVQSVKIDKIQANPNIETNSKSKAEFRAAQKKLPGMEDKVQAQLLKYISEATVESSICTFNVEHFKSYVEHSACYKIMLGNSVKSMIFSYTMLECTPWLSESVSVTEFESLKTYKEIQSQIVISYPSSKLSNYLPSSTEFLSYEEHYKRLDEFFTKYFNNENNTSEMKTLPPLRFVRGNDLMCHLYKNIAFSMLGCDGQFLWVNAFSKHFHLLYNAKHFLTLSETYMVLYYSNLGYYINQLKLYSTADESSPLHILGETGSALAHGLTQELNTYYEFFNKNIYGTTELNLRTIRSWHYKNVDLIKFLKFTIGKCYDLFAQQPIATTIYNLLGNGNIKLDRMLERLLISVLRPYCQFIANWLLYGAIIDQFKEYFILEQRNVPQELSWQLCFKFCTERVPNFFNYRLVKQIFDAGKSRNFYIRLTGNGHQSKYDIRSVRQRLEFCVESLLKNYNDVALRDYIGEHYRKSALELVDYYRKEMCYLEHLKMLKKYVLLSDQYFVYVYLEELELIRNEDLTNKYCTMDINSKFRIALDIANMNSRELSDLFEYLSVDISQDIFDELILEWDALTIVYEIHGDLNFLLLKSMEIYRQLNKHIWRIHRMDSLVFNRILYNQKLVTRIRAGNAKTTEMLFQFLNVAHKIVAFMTSLRFYVLTGVLETAWLQLCQRVECLTCLDDLLVAHNIYLDYIKQGVFLSADATEARQHLTSIFKLILEFKQLQEFLLSECPGKMEMRKFTFEATVAFLNEKLQQLNFEFETKIQYLIVKLQNAKNSSWLLFADTINFNYFYKEI